MNTFGFQFAIGTGSVADRAHHIRGRVVAHCRQLDLLRQFFEGSPVGDRDEAFFELHDAATIEQIIPLTSTDPGFGRVKYWFVDEGRRVGKLYLPEGSDQFRSRHVHRLAYASQRLTRRERDARRRARIMRRLGADAHSLAVPGKPYRMRWLTYRRLLSRLLHTRGPHDSLAVRTFMSDLTILAGP
jgi:hypothetical protein